MQISCSTFKPTILPKRSLPWSLLFGIIAMILPYAAESYPLSIRGRATGWIAACTKGGGLIAQLLSLLALVPALFVAALLILVPVLLSLGLVWRYCIETRGRDLRDLENAPQAGTGPLPSGLRTPSGG